MNIVFLIPTFIAQNLNAHPNDYESSTKFSTIMCCNLDISASLIKNEFVMTGLGLFTDALQKENH